MILHDKKRDKNELCHFCHFVSFGCASTVLFNTSVLIKINLFSFRLNGLKSNYFCGELSHVSVLLVFCVCLILPQAQLYSCCCCVPIFHVCGNQHDITGFVIMTNLFSFRLNGHKSNYFGGELSHVCIF